MKVNAKSLLIVVFLILWLVPPASANFSVNVRIIDAWYTDLDGDGKKDDIAVNMRIDVSNNYIYTSIDLYVGLKLPSGSEIWFKTSFVFKKYYYSDSIGVLYRTYNTARESGWYTAATVGFAEGERFSYMDYHVFDPPGHNQGNPSGSPLFYDI